MISETWLLICKILIFFDSLILNTFLICLEVIWSLVQILVFFLLNYFNIFLLILFIYFLNFINILFITCLLLLYIYFLITFFLWFIGEIMLQITIFLYLRRLLLIFFYNKKIIKNYFNFLFLFLINNFILIIIINNFISILLNILNAKISRKQVRYLSILKVRGNAFHKGGFFSIQWCWLLLLLL